jgi:hypothetical protein
VHEMENKELKKVAQNAKFESVKIPKEALKSH